MTSTTEGCLALVGASSAWASGLFRSTSANCSLDSGSLLGFVSFGSFPSLIALAIRTAFHLANLILAWISASGVPHILTSSRKVAEAWNVSAVCLHKVRTYSQIQSVKPYFVTLSAWTARSARSKVSNPNCSTYACPAMSSTIASFAALSALICHHQLHTDVSVITQQYLLQLIHQCRGVL